jgi:hypothetical protein
MDVTIEVRPDSITFYGSFSIEESMQTKAPWINIAQEAHRRLASASATRSVSFRLPVTG